MKVLKVIANPSIYLPKIKISSSVINLQKRFSRDTICHIHKLETRATLKPSTRRKDTSTKMARGLNAKEYTTFILVTCSKKDMINSLEKLSILPNLRTVNRHLQ